MVNRVEEIKKLINDKLKNLKELGKDYSEEKITALATNLASTNKTIEEISILIDNKFSNQIRKVSHNNHLASLKEYYIKLQSLYNNAVNMITAINQSLTTSASEISLNIEDISSNKQTTVRIPSFIYLENKLEQLNSNFNNLFNIKLRVPAESSGTTEHFYHEPGCCTKATVRDYEGRVQEITSLSWIYIRKSEYSLHEDESVAKFLASIDVLDEGV